MSSCCVVSEFQALLEWRNTPSEGIDTSPAQRLVGRRCKTLLPTTEGLLKPRFSLVTDVSKLHNQKAKQKRFYNRGKRSLAPLKPGEAVRMRKTSILLFLFSGVLNCFC